MEELYDSLSQWRSFWFYTKNGYPIPKSKLYLGTINLFLVIISLTNFFSFPSIVFAMIVLGIGSLLGIIFGLLESKRNIRRIDNNKQIYSISTSLIHGINFVMDSLIVIEIILQYIMFRNISILLSNFFILLILVFFTLFNFIGYYIYQIYEKRTQRIILGYFFLIIGMK